MFCLFDRYIGWFCNFLRCELGCYKGICVFFNICNCDDGWIGKLCIKVICEMFCISYGKCIVLNICICESGWYGIICELLYVLGF